MGSAKQFIIKLVGQFFRKEKNNVKFLQYLLHDINTFLPYRQNKEHFATEVL